MTDTDCLICFESHNTIDCPDRKPQHCRSCNMFIKQLVDHSTLCGMKQWYFQPYKELFATPPLQRIIVGCNYPLRFLYEGDWRKPFGGEEMFSAASGIIVRFKNNKDFSCLTRKFAPVRIAFVVKEENGFAMKLMILASRTRFIVAANLDEPFDRYTAKGNYQWKTTLIVAVQSADDLCLAVMATPPRQLVRRYEVKYDKLVKKFNIPQELALNSATPSFEALSHSRQERDQLAVATLQKVNS